MRYDRGRKAFDEARRSGRPRAGTARAALVSHWGPSDGERVPGSFRPPSAAMDTHPEFQLDMQPVSPMGSSPAADPNRPSIGKALRNPRRSPANALQPATSRPSPLPARHSPRPQPTGSPPCPLAARRSPLPLGRSRAGGRLVVRHHELQRRDLRWDRREPGRGQGLREAQAVRPEGSLSTRGSLPPGRAAPGQSCAQVVGVGPLPFVLNAPNTTRAGPSRPSSAC